MDFYPIEIVNLAEECGVTVEEMADSKKAKRGVKQDYGYRADQIAGVENVAEDPFNKNRSIIIFETGMVDVIEMPFKKLLKKISDYLDSIEATWPSDLTHPSEFDDKYEIEMVDGFPPQ
jgi:hypothetical protein